MRIYTLGTSHGNPTRSRFHSSTAYVTEGGAIYLLDVGAPAEALLLRSGLSCSDVRAVLLTHMHDDHVGGLTSLLVRITKYASERSYPVSVIFSEERAIAPFRAWFSVLGEGQESDCIHYGSADDGVVYEDDNLIATAIRTAHLRSPIDGRGCSFAYDLYFKKERKRILHTGDLCYDLSDFPAVAMHEHFDACLCEATHYRPENVGGILSSAHLSRMIFTHIGERWHTNDGSRPKSGEGEEALLALTRTYPYPVSIAHDGEVFTL